MPPDNGDRPKPVTAREGGLRSLLYGPNPRELIDPVTADDLRAEMKVTLRKWDDYVADRSLTDWSRRFQGLMVLSICRILHTLDSGRVTAKREAGEWALTAVAAEWHDLIRGALDDRPDPWTKLREPADPSLLRRSYEFLDYALSNARS